MSSDGLLQRQCGESMQSFAKRCALRFENPILSCMCAICALRGLGSNMMCFGGGRSNLEMTFLKCTGDSMVRVLLLSVFHELMAEMRGEFLNFSVWMRGSKMPCDSVKRVGAFVVFGWKVRTSISR